MLEIIKSCLKLEQEEKRFFSLWPSAVWMSVGSSAECGSCVLKSAGCRRMDTKISVITIDAIIEYEPWSFPLNLTVMVRMCRPWQMQSEVQIIRDRVKEWNTLLDESQQLHCGHHYDFYSKCPDNSHLRFTLREKVFFSRSLQYNTKSAELRRYQRVQTGSTHYTAETPTGH